MTMPDTTRVARSNGGSLRRLANDCLLLLVGRTGIRVGAEFIRGMDGEYGHPTAAEWSLNGHGPVSEDQRLRESTFYLPKDRDADGDDSPPVRAVALDLDSKTVDEAGLRDRVAGTLNYTGGGAEMLWPQGYHDAEQLRDEIEAVLDTAGAGSVRNFLLFHSTSQGTGSGVASWIVDHIRETYCEPGQRRNLLSFTVVPSGGTDRAIPYKEFEEVSGPSYYNTAMTLSTLLGCRPGQPDVEAGSLRVLSVLMDNPAVARAFEQSTGEFPTDPQFGEINYVMARTALSLTAMLRYGPTDIGNVMVDMSEHEPRSIAVPSISPIEPGEAETPFEHAYAGLLQNRLLQDTTDPEKIYYVLRGEVDRSGLRHVNDLFRDRFDISADFFNVVEEATPRFESEFASLHRPAGIPDGLRSVLARAEENLRTDRYLTDYRAWDVEPDTIQSAIDALREALRRPARREVTA